MLKFLARIFGTEKSGQTAKERLKLVLLSDHLSLAPEVVDALKSDLLAVIERYVEIDASNVVVDFEHREREIALTANVPIIAMRERPLPPSFGTAPALTLVPPAHTNGASNGVSSPPRATNETPVTSEAPTADETAVAGAEAVASAPANEEQAVAEQPVAEQPVAEQPVAEQPVAEQPVSEQPVAEQPADEQSAPPSDAVAAPPEELQAVASAEYPAELPGVNAAPRNVPAQKQRTRRRRRKGGPAPVSAPPLGNAAKA